MSKSAVFFLVLAITMATLVTACSLTPNTGASSSVISGQIVTLSIPLRDQVKINIDGDPIDYYVGMEAAGQFTGGMFWVRKNGQEISLQEAVRGSDPEPLIGTWVITEENGKTVLHVYADPDMASQGK